MFEINIGKMKMVGNIAFRLLMPNLDAIYLKIVLL